MRRPSLFPGRRRTVPHGHHPCGMPYGLNVMAGLLRASVDQKRTLRRLHSLDNLPLHLGEAPQVTRVGVSQEPIAAREADRGQDPDQVRILSGDVRAGDRFLNWRGRPRPARSRCRTRSGASCGLRGRPNSRVRGGQIVDMRNERVVGGIGLVLHRPMSTEVVAGGVDSERAVGQLAHEETSLLSSVERHHDVGAPRQRKGPGRRDQLHHQVRMGQGEGTQQRARPRATIRFPFRALGSGSSLRAS